MGKTRGYIQFGLTNLLIWLVLIVTCIFGENVDLFANVYDTKMSLDASIVITILALTLILLYLYFEFRHNKQLLDVVILIFCILFFSIGISGIWRVDEATYTLKGVDYLASVEVPKKIGYTLLTIIGALTTYILLAIFPKRRTNSRLLLWICYVGVAICLISMIISFTLESKMYGLIFKGGEQSIVIKSFFNNENVYGYTLMMGIFALMMASCKWNRWFNYILMAILFIGIIFSTSVTAILISGVFSIIFILYQLISTFNKHPFKNVIIATTLLVVIGSLAIGYSELTRHEVDFVVHFNEFLHDYILNKDFEGLSGRWTVWEVSLTMLRTPLDYLFGLGFKTFNEYVRQWQLTSGWGESFGSVDSGYVQLLGSYGIVGLFLYFGMIMYFIYIFGYLIVKKRWKVAFGSIICLAGLQAYAFAETLVLFEPTVKGTCSIICFVVPLLTEYNLIKEPELKKEVKERKYDEIEIRKREPRSLAKLLSTACISLLLASSLLLLFPSFREGARFHLTLFVIFVSFIFTLFLPWLFNIMARRKYPNKHYVATFMLEILFLIGCAIAVLVLHGYKASLIATSIALLIVALITVLTYTTKYSSFDNYITFMFNDVIKSNLINTLILGFIYLGINLGLSKLPLDQFGLFSMFLLGLIEFVIFNITIYLLPNFKGDRQLMIASLYNINDRYVLMLKTAMLPVKERRKIKKENLELEA